MICPGSMALHSISSHVKFATVRSCQPIAKTKADGPPPVGSSRLLFRNRTLLTALRHCAMLTLFNRTQSATTSQTPLQQSFFRHKKPQRTSHIFQFRSPELYLIQTQIQCCNATITLVINHFSFESLKVNKSRRMRWAGQVT